MKQISLKNINLDCHGKKFKLDECEFVDVGVFGRFSYGRLFYKKEDSWIYFIGLWVTAYACDTKDVWADLEDTDIEVSFVGSVFEQELKHLYTGSKTTGNYGYFYYPDVQSMVLMLNEISELCR